MEDRLKPCPFCGGKAHTYTYSTDFKGFNGKGWLVRCDECWLNYPCRIKCRTEQEAIEAWNTRNPMDRIVEQLEEYPIKLIDITNNNIILNGIPKEKAIEIVKAGGIDE